MKFRERYHYNPTTDKLGSGGFASVYKAFDTLLERDVALKIFHASESERVNLLSELKKMSRLDHPHLVRCLDIILVETTNIHGLTEQLNIGVMEYANRGSLKEFSAQHPGKEVVRDLLVQILEGLSYLHAAGIIHRDLKPQNILLHQNGEQLMAKITDFGVSKSLAGDTRSSSVLMGTIEYMAPEQFNPAKYGIGGRIATNLDLWSFGILTYELVSGRHLFGAGDRSRSSEQVMNSILSFSLPEDAERLPEPFRSVVKRCLVPDANQRAKEASELISLLRESGKAETGYGFKKEFKKEVEEVQQQFEDARKSAVQETVTEMLTGETMVLEKERSKPQPGVGNQYPKEPEAEATVAVVQPGKAAATVKRTTGSRMPVYIAAALVLLAGIGALLQSMSAGPMLAPYVTGVMWSLSSLCSVLFIHLSFSGKSHLKLSPVDTLPLKKLGWLALGCTALSPVISGIMYLVAKSQYTGIIWDHYTENFFLGVGFLLTLFYLLLGVVFIVGMVQPDTIGYPRRRAVGLSVLLLFLTPLIIFFLIAKFSSYISGPL